MNRLLVLCLFLVFSFCSCAAENSSNNGNVGYPTGFYDDIDPNAPDDSYRTVNDKYYEPVEPVVSVKPTKNYSQIYSNLEPADFAYQHDIDPDQYYDVKDAAWSIYPLFRLNSPIYFKSITIEPGYYLLTPREHGGKWYILFKQNGLVKHIIPVYDSDYTPEKFYDEHIPKPKLTKSQKIHMGILNTVGKVKSSKRKEPVKSFLEVNDLDNYFLSIIIYYGGHKYYTIFRTIRL